MQKGWVLKIERERRGLESYRLAQMLHIAPSTLSLYESGRRTIPCQTWADAARILNSKRMIKYWFENCPVIRGTKEAA